MGTNGISFHLYPSPDGPGSHKIAGYADEWLDGTAVRSEMFLLSDVAIHKEDYEDLTHYEFGAMLAEVLTQILGKRTHIRDVARFTETVARIVEGSETLSDR